MLELQVPGLSATGNATFGTAISDLMILEGPSGPVLVSISGPAGGVVGWRLSAGALPQMASTRTLAADALTGTGASLSLYEQDGSARALVAGVERAGVNLTTAYASGTLGRPDLLEAGTSQDWALAAQVNDQILALAENDGTGFALYAVLSGGSLSHLRQVNDNGNTHARDLSAMVSLSIGNRDFLLTASASEQGISSYQISGSSVSHRGRVGPNEGLGIMTPTALEVARVGNRWFAILGSAAPNQGETGALSVMEISATGQLLPTDHIMDNRDSRFAMVQDIAVLSHDGWTFVAAGGGDDGVSLFALAENGELVHLTAFENQLGASLDGVTALEMAVLGDQLQIYVGTGGGGGLTVLSTDLSGLGQIHMASDSGGALTGGSGADILFDGDGLDTLDGQGSADIFVLRADGQADRIVNFNPNVDRLDLSHWPLLYDVNTIQITPTANGARLEARGEVLYLRGPNDRSLTADEVRAAILLDIDRVFLPPSVAAQGSGTNERIEGSWGTDNLSGGGGNDTLVGFGGDDTITGGSGNDCVVFDLDMADAQVLSIRGDRVTIQSGEGTDVISGVEGFEFKDGMLTFSALSSLITPEILTGNSGNNTITYTSGPAQIDGQEGNDRLESGSGNDTLRGGAGNDTLIAGGGNDLLEGGSGSNRLRGGSGTDTASFALGSDQVWVTDSDGDQITLQSLQGTDVIDGVELFAFADQTLTLAQVTALTGPEVFQGNDNANQLTSGNGAALLLGAGGNDTMQSGNGNDSHMGGTGNDQIRAGRGDDTASGDEGNDEIWGDGGNDTVLGGQGHDTLRGGRDTDLLQGGDGNDVLRGQSHGDTLYGGNGNDNLKGGGGNDTHYGGAGNDFIKGGTRRDLLEGGGGNDSLSGNLFDDTLIGGSGDDTLKAGGDDDVLEGGSGDDFLKGGDGADRFVFDQGFDTDRIADFDPDQDVLVLSQALTGGLTDPAAVVNKYLALSANGYALNFGNGDILIFESGSSISGLSDAIEIL